MTEQYDVVIIGAGMSGLAAGIRLAYFDKSVCILERHRALGADAPGSLRRSAHSSTFTYSECGFFEPNTPMPASEIRNGGMAMTRLSSSDSSATLCSTSFSLATKMLAGSIRQDIYNIYGFVRFADEIVDSFHEYDKEDLLDRFESDLEHALTHQIGRSIDVLPVFRLCFIDLLGEVHTHAF